MDIASRNLDAAILDQEVAGAFHGRGPYAYVAVPLDPPLHDHEWGVGIAVKNESGYTPIIGVSFAWETFEKADAFAKAMNEHIGIGERAAAIIVASSMRGRPPKIGT